MKKLLIGLAVLGMLVSIHPAIAYAEYPGPTSTPSQTLQPPGDDFCRPIMYQTRGMMSMASSFGANASVSASQFQSMTSSHLPQNQQHSINKWGITIIQTQHQSPNGSCSPCYGDYPNTYID